MPDLPRRRAPDSAWLQPMKALLSRSIKVIIALNVLAYLVFLFVHEVQAFLIGWFSVTPDLRHAPWQPLTAMFLHVGTSAGDLFSFLLGVLGIWFVGGALERTLGTRRFLALFFGAGVLANVAIALLARVFGLQTIYIGPSLALLALFVAFARVYGPVPTQVIPGVAFKATHTALFFVAIGIVLDLAHRDVPGLGGTLVATAAGWLLAAPGGWRVVTQGLRLRGGRPRYKVLDGGASRRAHKYWN